MVDVLVTFSDKSLHICFPVNKAFLLEESKVQPLKKAMQEFKNMTIDAQLYDCKLYERADEMNSKISEYELSLPESDGRKTIAFAEFFPLGEVSHPVTDLIQSMAVHAPDTKHGYAHAILTGSENQHLLRYVAKDLPDGSFVLHVYAPNNVYSSDEVVPD